VRAGEMVEVGISLVNVSIPEDNWPGKYDAMRTGLVGRIPLEHSGEVVVVHRTREMWKEAPVQHEVTRNYFRGMSEADCAEANRMVGWGEEPDGSIKFVECPVVVAPAVGG
jgi:hypothetical protein